MKCLRDCALGILTCLAYLLFLPFAIVGMLLFAIFFVGPIIYYDSTVLNSHALMAKYASEGVECRGRVTKRWKDNSGDHGTKFFIQVAYRGGHGHGMYTKKFSVSGATYELNEVALARLPEYPRSAIMLESVKHFDEDFPPSKVSGLFFAFIWTTLWNVIPAAIILGSIESCSYCSRLLGPIFFGSVCLEYFTGYWVASRIRDKSLWDTLYGAKKISTGRGNGRGGENIPKKISYKDFFDEKSLSCTNILCQIIRDLLLVVLWILAFVYFLAFGGGYLLFQGVVYSRMKQKALSQYELHATSTKGEAVGRRQGSQAVIVSYEVQSVTYKKKMRVPIQAASARRRGVAAQLTIPDDPDLLYLNEHPTSAELKCRIERRGEDPRLSPKRALCSGLFCLAIQVSLITLVAASIADAEEMKLHIGVIGGIAAIGILVAGCLGGCINYYACFLKDLLHGAKVVSPREVTPRVVEDPVPEVEHAVVLDEAGQTDDETEASEDEADEEDATNNFFPGGRIPEVDRLRALLRS